MFPLLAPLVDPLFGQAERAGFDPAGARAPHFVRAHKAGHFIEIIPNARLVIDMSVAGADGELLFSAHTVVGFTEEAGGTRVDVNLAYTVFQSIAEQMIKGARQGWTETLDRLGRALA
jgi:uncharacterized protein YndB with AHSA1/START domain